MTSKNQSREPEPLRRGKAFQKYVQADYFRNWKEGEYKLEKTISLQGLKDVRQKRGRMDILIEESHDDDGVTIMEIKATDWDKIKEKNIRRNLWRHSRQLYRYIDKYMDVDKVGSVVPAMIYPSAPKKTGLREKIEEMAFELYSFPVYWYDEIKS